MEKRLIQMDFSTAFEYSSHCGLLYKLRFITVGGQFLFIVSEFFSDRRQIVRLDGKVSASVDVDSGVHQSSVLGSLLFILYTSELFHIVESYIVRHAENTTIYAAIPRLLSRP